MLYGKLLAIFILILVWACIRAGRRLDRVLDGKEAIGAIRLAVRSMRPVMSQQEMDANCMKMIHALRAEEGDAITIICDNPDFDGPGAAVEWAGEATGWVNRRFTGDTFYEALHAAFMFKVNTPSLEALEIRSFTEGSK